MKTNKREKKVIHPYSEESINLKLKIIYISSLILRMIIILPFLLLIHNNIYFYKMSFIYKIPKFIRILLCLIISIVLSVITTKKQTIKNPLFLDDSLVISNKKKSNGIYEDVSTSKFNLLFGFNIACIIPLSFILGLTISSILCLILNLFHMDYIVVSIIKYILTIIFFKMLANTFNNALIVYLRTKKD